MKIPLPGSGLYRRMGRWAGVVSGAAEGVRAVAAGSARFGGELSRIALGASEVAPPKGDRRFVDPAWTSNPMYRRIGQAYLLSAREIEDAVVSAESPIRFGHNNSPSQHGSS
ncbi:MULTISPECIES: hypothetical protein [Rhodococcus]|uniref:hypothetical protein n=1 Tax=Rhodococcus TaxID=1827 RepID=UPI000B070F7B|nr:MULTISPECIES: hypothetical protein [Rhodococcus]WKW97735.1 hypothetical protein Q3O43_22320 [Rhodococcus aetherivorans]